MNHFQKTGGCGSGCANLSVKTGFSVKAMDDMLQSLG